MAKVSVKNNTLTHDETPPEERAYNGTGCVQGRWAAAAN